MRRRGYTVVKMYLKRNRGDFSVSPAALCAAGYSRNDIFDRRDFSARFAWFRILSAFNKNALVPSESGAALARNDNMKRGGGAAFGRAHSRSATIIFYFCLTIIKLSSRTPLRSTVWRFMATYPRLSKKPFAVSDAKVVILSCPLSSSLQSAVAMPLLCSSR